MSAFLYPVFGHPTYTSVFGYGLQVRSDPTSVRGKPDTGISEKLTISVSGFLFLGKLCLNVFGLYFIGI